MGLGLVALDKNQLLIYRGTNTIKVSLLYVLRAIFANPAIVKDERYRYVPTTEESATNKTKISIYRSYPKRIETYPSIIISSGAYDADLMSMGEEREDGSQHFDSQGSFSAMSYVGYSSIPITMTVTAKNSTDDRENLTDILVMILRILGRGQFSRFGFSYNKIAISGDAEEPADDGEILYRNSVTINCNTDYWYLFDKNQQELINAIGIKVFGQLTGTSPLVNLHPD